MTDKEIESLAMKAGAAKFYPEAQRVNEQNYLVPAGFLRKFYTEIVKHGEAKNESPGNV